MNRRLMHHTVYARAGHHARNEWLHDHFAAQPWHEPLANGRRQEDGDLR